MNKQDEIIEAQRKTINVLFKNLSALEMEVAGYKGLTPWGDEKNLPMRVETILMYERQLEVANQIIARYQKWFRENPEAVRYIFKKDSQKTHA